jgi:WD40 repeat protein
MAFVQSKQLQSWEQGASLWDLGTGQWEKSFFKRGHSVSCVVLFDVLLATSATPGQGRGCTVQLWHAPTGTTLSTISNPAPVTALFVAEIVKVGQDETHRLSGSTPEREPLRDGE